jgi:dihydropteroate synthase
VPLPPFTVASLPRRAVMGILNVTPDSFSDGGAYASVEAAVAQACHLHAMGADLIDIGGESTRPGAEPVPVSVELARVLPVLEGVIAAFGELGAGPWLSIDTRSAEVADAALTAGAHIVNDVSAGRDDAAMLETVAAHSAGFVAMHRQGVSSTMQDAPQYRDVVGEVGEFLAERIAAAGAAGIRTSALLADPGIGFGKTTAHNLALLAALEQLRTAAGAPLLVGTSRKRFLGTLDGDAPVDERDDQTLATTIWAWSQGGRVVRVHDAEAAARAARFLDVVDRATPDGVVAA